MTLEEFQLWVASRDQAGRAQWQGSNPAGQVAVDPDWPTKPRSRTPIIIVIGNYPRAAK